MKENIYFIYATEKTTNNTPISPYTTYAYHPISQLKSWWYTINLSHSILSYLSFSDNGIGWYGRL
jgi:hypothetical protein